MLLMCYSLYLPVSIIYLLYFCLLVGMPAGLQEVALGSISFLKMNENTLNWFITT
jgi:hypothetical protein